MKPYLHDLDRRMKLGHEDEAFEICKGIVLGLYRAERSGFDLLEYAEDCPSELAGRAVEIWRRRRRKFSFPRSSSKHSRPSGSGWLAERTGSVVPGQPRRRWTEREDTTSIA